MTKHFARRMILMIFAMAVSACASPPPSYFILSTPADASAQASQQNRNSRVSIGVGPVELPKYLDRNEIVSRTTVNSLKVDDLNLWGGELRENFQMVLGEVLSEKLRTERVQMHPWPVSGSIDYQVLVQVNAFEASPEGQAVLDARWTVVKPETEQIIRMGRTQVREPISSDPNIDTQNYELIAAAMSRNILRLGADIAATGAIR